MNLDAILRIAAKVTGTEAVQALNRAVGAAGNTAEAAKKSFKGVVNSAAWQGAAVVATGIGVALGVATKQAIEFESAVADVRKVVSGLDTPAGLTAIRQEILQLSREMPITAQGFAEIYAAAGQSGIAREQIRAFAIDVTKMAVAFDMTAGEAGEAMAKMRTALGLSQPEVLSLADALNHLSNNTASTGAELVNFTKRSGVMGKQAGLSAEQTAAFGAAMIGAGVDVEVASTSFNNMIRSLSRGASMTARQESALKRLGLASRTVADGEREMTAAVQRGSDRRLEILQDESDRQQAELRKRYRRQLQLLEDQWEDESDAYTDGLQDQTDAQIKALQRQADARIKALQKQSGDNEAWLDQQTDAVRDQLEREIDAIRDATDRTLKLQQRADRDRRQQVRDSMDERMDDEAKALERINKQRVEAEKEGTKQAIEAAKAAAGDGGSAAGKELSKRLQTDALGTIRDVFSKIRGLAADERISVISDLFGDEARGLAPLIDNMGALEKALGLVGDKTAYAGSMTKEYEVRSQTAANALQLAQNNFNALAIEIGAQVVPALIKVVKFLNPIITGLSKFASANPQITAVAVAVAALGSAFVIAAPFIASTISVLATMGPILAGLGATIAGFAGAIGPVVAAIGAVVAAIGLWPIVIGAAVVAAIALIWKFRHKIGAFFQKMAQMAIDGWNALIAPLQPALDAIGQAMAAGWSAIVEAAYNLFVKPWVDLWKAIRPAVTGFWEWIKSVFTTAFTAILAIGYMIFVTPWVLLWDAIKKPVTDAWEWIKATTNAAFSALPKLAYDLFVKHWVDLWNNVLREPIAQAWKWMKSTWSTIAGFFTKTVITPIQQGWSALATNIQQVWIRVSEFIPKTFQTVTGKIKSILNGIIGSITNGINSIIRSINGLIKRFNNVAAATKNPFRVSYLQEVSLPQFARGGYVTAPTLGLVGEAGREYIVPEGKAAGFANNIMAGRRGAAAIPSSSGSSGGGAVSINITTGPIRQDASGQRWMTIEDGESMVRQAVGQMQRTSRTPGGRYAAGVR